MALENLMNQHMEHMEQRVLSVVIPLDILRIITKVQSMSMKLYIALHCSLKRTLKSLPPHHGDQIVLKICKAEQIFKMGIHYMYKL